jgi:hypothetical protein
MADLSYAVTRGSLNTSIGTMDFTVPGFGTPKAAIFVVTSADTDDTITANSTLAMGYTDGVNEYAQSSTSEDGQSSVDSDRAYHKSSVIFLVNGSGALAGQAVFDSWITDGVRIDITDAFLSGHLCHVFLFGGDGILNVTAIKHGLGSTTSGNTLTLGYEPSFIFTSNGYTSSSGGAVHRMISLGAWLNDGIDTQKSIILGMPNNAGESDVECGVYDNEAGGAAYVVKRFGLTIDNATSTGVDFTTSSSTGTEAIGLAFEFHSDIDVALFDTTIPTSGNYAETAPGFEPIGGMLFGIVGVTTRNTYTESGVSSLYWTAFDDSNIFTANIADEDGSDPIVSKSLSADRLRVLDTDASADSFVASSYAFDSDGWDFTLTDNPASAVLGFGFAFGNPGGGGPSFNPAWARNSNSIIQGIG